MKKFLLSMVTFSMMFVIGTVAAFAESNDFVEKKAVAEELKAKIEFELTNPTVSEKVQVVIPSKDEIKDKIQKTDLGKTMSDEELEIATNGIIEDVNMINQNDFSAQDYDLRNHFHKLVKSWPQSSSEKKVYGMAYTATNKTKYVADLSIGTKTSASTTVGFKGSAKFAEVFTAEISVSGTVSTEDSATYTLKNAAPGTSVTKQSWVRVRVEKVSAQWEKWVQDPWIPLKFNYAGTAYDTYQYNICDNIVDVDCGTDFK